MPVSYTHLLDEESDKIVWAAKYPFDPAVRMDDSLIQPEKMVPVPFTDQLAECDLDPHWVLMCIRDRSCTVCRQRC